MAKISRRLALAAPLLGYIASKTQALAQTRPPAPDTDWLVFGGNNANTRYSPLDQINPDNFKSLEVAWRFETSPYGPHPDSTLEVTPLVSKGRMFFTAGARRDAVSIDAATGEVLWVYRLEEGERAALAEGAPTGRGA